MEDNRTMGQSDNQTSRKGAEAQRAPMVQFHDEFLQVALSKLEFLMGQGGRCVEIVLEDKQGQQAHLDRFGRVTWTNVHGSNLSASAPLREALSGEQR